VKGKTEKNVAKNEQYEESVCRGHSILLKIVKGKLQIVIAKYAPFLSHGFSIDRNVGSVRLFVDPFVELSSKRWIPVEHIEFLAVSRKRLLGDNPH